MSQHIQRPVARATIRSRGTLPHVEQPGSTYFVTFRAADAMIPRCRREPDREATWNALAEHSEPPLRAGACVLARDDIGPVIEAALRHFDGERYLLGAWCVMPNHVHALVAPLGGARLAAILHSWKSFSARRINQILRRRGSFWEREYFDHRIRNARWTSWFAEYVEWNPVTAGLCRRPEEWRFGSAYWRAEAMR